MNSKTIALSAVALLLAAALFAGLNMATPATAAPMSAPTPVSVARSPEQPHVATLMDSQVITSDTRGGCVNSTLYEKTDVQYEIDQGTANSTTLKLQFTNETPGEASASYVNGLSVVVGAAADATNMQQMQVFGAWTCIYADVTNTNAMTLTVKALMK